MRESSDFAGGDRRSWRQHFAPDVVWDTSQSQLPAAGVYRGHEGIEQFFADWLSDLGRLRRGERRVSSTPEIRSSSCSRQRGRGKGSGAHAERTFFGVYDLEAGKVTRFRMHESREAALEAVGLSE